MNAEIKQFPQLEAIAGTKFKRLIAPFPFYSAIIGKWDEIPKGFIYDEESTPWRGSNPIAGLIHDYLSRKDSINVSKYVAAKVYLEFQKYEDGLYKQNLCMKWHNFVWRNIKAGFVALCPDPVYWHKYSVNAPLGEFL